MKMKKSSYLQQQLKKAADELNVEGGRVVVRDVVTRWNSTFLMIQSYEKLLRPINIVISNNDAKLRNLKLTTDECATVKSIGKILKPFLSLTTRVSASAYPVLSVAVHGFFRLLNNLRQLQTDQYLEEMLQIAVKAMIEKFEKYEPFMSDLTSYMSCILDPRVKLQKSPIN
ncbi:hypothetical protein GEMRC1_013425 [Eukaryota sp. GEM-RC1]